MSSWSPHEEWVEQLVAKERFTTPYKIMLSQQSWMMATDGRAALLWRDSSSNSNPYSPYEPSAGLIFERHPGPEVDLTSLLAWTSLFGGGERRCDRSHYKKKLFVDESGNVNSINGCGEQRYAPGILFGQSVDRALLRRYIRGLPILDHATIAVVDQMIAIDSADWLVRVMGLHGSNEPAPEFKP